MVGQGLACQIMVRRWIEGEAGSGKTSRLIEIYCGWLDKGIDSRAVACFAATSELRQRLATRILAATEQTAIPQTFTPLSFCEHEVKLYWPLIQAKLGLLARQPLVLRSENEQELARDLFADRLPMVPGLTPDQVVRHCVDNLQLAAVAGLPVSAIATRLLLAADASLPLATLEQVTRLAEMFHDACLQQGLLTYSLMSDLYCQVLLPLPQYQTQVRQRWQALLCDDVDELPPLVLKLLDQLRDREIALSFNPSGAVRLGYGADPQAWQVWGTEHCAFESLMAPPLPPDFATVLALVQTPETWDLPSASQVQSLQTSSRRDLLRAVAAAIAAEVESGTAPDAIAVIAPGLDAIASYTLTTLLEAQQIPVQSFDAATPLWTVAWVRALLHLMALIYPGCGSLISPSAIAEMLVIVAGIDPVRAGLLADTCFQPSLTQPQLLASTCHPRRDRLGAQASVAYDDLVQWVANHTAQQPLAEFFLEAMQHFGLERSQRDISAYRSLSEAAQRYTAVAQRLGQDPTTIAANFYRLLAQGTVTAQANRRDFEPVGVSLSSIFQYRSHHQQHRVHFWLDAGSHLWTTAYSSFGGFQIKNPYIYLENWREQPWSAEQTQVILDEQLDRSVRDLLQRCRDRLILCHSDLSLNGSETRGPLLPLLDYALPLEIA